jgi:CRP-like cAMP-binding protein
LSLESDVRRLGRAKPLAALPREALQLIAFSGEKRKLEVGETLFSAGDAADGAFVVLEGELVLSIGGAERRAFAGALIGEQALLVETRRPSDAKAVSETQVLKITRETFRRVLTEFPQSAAALREDAVQRTGRLLGELERLRRRGFAGPPA